MSIEQLPWQDTIALAQALVGCVLLDPKAPGMVLEILETEAYVSGDAASHAYRGKTDRNAPMFAPAGTLYVYLSYGIHYCLNIVSANEGVGEAVLIRAVRVYSGEDIASQRLNRPMSNGSIIDGPGLVGKLLSAELRWNTCSLFEAGSPLRLQVPVNRNDQIFALPRIGISKNTDAPLRFRAASATPAKNRKGSVL